MYRAGRGPGALYPGVPAGPGALGTPILSPYRSRSLVTRRRNHKCTTPNMGSKPTPVLEVQGRGGQRACVPSRPSILLNRLGTHATGNKGHYGHRLIGAQKDAIFYSDYYAILLRVMSGTMSIVCHLTLRTGRRSLCILLDPGHAVGGATFRLGIMLGLSVLHG